MPDDLGTDGQQRSQPHRKIGGVCIFADTAQTIGNVRFYPAKDQAVCGRSFGRAFSVLVGGKPSPFRRRRYGLHFAGQPIAGRLKLVLRRAPSLALPSGVIAILKVERRNRRLFTEQSRLVETGEVLPENIPGRSVANDVMIRLQQHVFTGLESDQSERQGGSFGEVEFPPRRFLLHLFEASFSIAFTREIDERNRQVAWGLDVL